MKAIISGTWQTSSGVWKTFSPFEVKIVDELPDPLQLNWVGSASNIDSLYRYRDAWENNPTAPHQMLIELVP